LSGSLGGAEAVRLEASIGALKPPKALRGRSGVAKQPAVTRMKGRSSGPTALEGCLLCAPASIERADGVTGPLLPKNLTEAWFVAGAMRAL